MGKKHAPAYRIIVTERRSKRDGKYIDLVGTYNPSMNPVNFELDKEKLKDWLTKGAQISEGLQKVLDNQKVKIN